MIEDLRREMAEASADEARYLAELARLSATSRANRSLPQLRSPDGDAGESDVGETVSGEAGLTVLTDATLPDASRIEVLDRLGGLLSSRLDGVDALLAIVGNGDDSAAVRAAALGVLGIAADQAGTFAPRRQAYDDLLRTLITDPVAELRQTAVADLAYRHDPVAQAALLAGLRGEGPLPVDRDEAIDLLAQDDHLDTMPWLLQMYGSGGEGARMTAVRHMASHPAAQETLEAVLHDRSESPLVRQQAASSLRFLVPDRFDELAKEIAVDPTDDPRVRTSCLHTLAHLSDAERVYGDAAFLDRVADVAQADVEAPVADVARTLLANRAGR